jgi:hypothetical protein
MMALTKILAGGAVVAALVSAAPASAQYYPGYGYGNGGNVIGQVLNQVLGGGVGYGGYGNYGGYGGYGAGNQQAAVSQCAAAVQQRLGGGYGGGYGGNGNSGYSGGYGGYGNNGYNGGGRVLGISRVEPRSGGGVTVRGVASSGGYAGYGYGYNGQSQADLTFKCKADYRGFVTSVSFDRVNRSSTYNNSPYDYSQYGYRRY